MVVVVRAVTVSALAAAACFDEGVMGLSLALGRLMEGLQDLEVFNLTYVSCRRGGPV